MNFFNKKTESELLKKDQVLKSNIISNIDLFNNEIVELLRARFPFIYVTTWEETRVVKTIEQFCNDKKIIRTKRDCLTWSSASGFIKDKELIKKNTKDPMKALEFIQAYNSPAVFILKDFHVYFNQQNRQSNNILIRKLRDIIPNLTMGDKIKNVIFLSPTLTIPNELMKDVTVIDFELPTFYEIESKLDELIKANKGTSVKIKLSLQEKESLCKAALGLTLQESENAFSRAMVNDGILDANDISLMKNEKKQIIQKAGLLEFYDSNFDISDVGGMDNLKKWLIKRNKSWMNEAKLYCLPKPKGILLTGVPGCGKSLFAKVVGNLWEMPLLKLDIGKIFGSLVGQSEENMRRAIKTAEAVAPCILWIDEIEKGFSGVNSRSGDGGLSSKIFGTFLTWMQEKEKSVFVIATANNIDNLPPEFMRKGRFDEIFFVDLPTNIERKQIFKIHLNKRLIHIKAKGNFEINEKTLTTLSNHTEGFIGSEIEHIVISALFDAYYKSSSINMEFLEKAINNTVPLSITQAEGIMRLRNWAETRAVSATSKENRSGYEEIKQKPRKDNDSSETDITKFRGGRTIDI